MSSKNNYFEAHYKELPIKEKDETKTSSSYGYGVRHVQVFLTFSTLTLSFVARAHLGVTIVAMTNIPISNHSNNSIALVRNISRNFENNSTVWEDMDYENVVFDGYDDSENNTGGISNNSEGIVDDGGTPDVQTYDWPKSTQEMVLGSFFLGYALMMFPMGMICQRWGGKFPVQFALFVNGVVSLVSPWLIAWGGWKAICVCRVLQGCSQSGLYPSVQILVSKWSHPSERSSFLSYVYTGTTVGTIIAYQVSGLLAATSVGWPSTFWMTGALCLVMFIMISIFGSASPAEHKSISAEEKKFIMEGSSKEVVKRRRVPWKAILTSRYVWANVVTHVGSGLVFVFFFNQVPSYIHHILKMNVTKSGMLSSLPYMVSFFTSIAYGILTDFFINRKILSIASARRIANSLAQVGMAVCLVATSFTQTVEIALVWLTLALTFHVAVHCGWMVNHIDLSPNFSSTLMAFGNTFTCTGTFLMPVVIASVITDMTNQLQWRIMFIGMSAVAVCTNCLFVIFMTSDTQPWNDYGDEGSEAEKELRVEENRR